VGGGDHQGYHPTQTSREGLERVRKRPEIGQHGAAKGLSGRRSRQPGKKRVPREHEPRDPHAHEWNHRHDRAVARYRFDTRTARIRRHGSQLLRFPLGDYQRYPRLLEDRSGATRPRDARLQPDENPGRDYRCLGAEGAGKGHRIDLHGRTGCAHSAPRRCRQTPADTTQPGQQRGEVHDRRGSHRWCPSRPRENTAGQGWDSPSRSGSPN